jgi:vacuolar-type H+-ATPase subunit C/Vma6
MFIVNTLEDIVNVCNSITPETYNQMLPYVQENYERSIKYAKFRETLRDEVIEFVKNS